MADITAWESEASAEPNANGIVARRRTRALVMQALYESDAVEHSAVDVLDERLSEMELSWRDAEFARKLLDGIFANATEIDKIISEFAPGWPISQMAVVDRNILRMAIYEIMVSQDTPPRVAVNEAVELAKAFGADSAPRFINGVLGSVMAAASR
ncbi:MAG: transcription antitermination factor NusB [Chloroflexi bacterium]|nr:transcription antitermination factor NusB [Chloroflexota bacterium]